MISGSISVEEGVWSPSETNDVLKHQIKWNNFHHMDPEYFFHYF